MKYGAIGEEADVAGHLEAPGEHRGPPQVGSSSGEAPGTGLLARGAMRSLVPGDLTIYRISPLMSSLQLPL